MGSREELPKISIDKIENWNRVALNCKRDALKIAEAQWQDAGLGAERELLRTHMEQYLDQALLNAQPNLRVNGHSFGSLQAHNNPHEMETFDEALDRRIWSLADTRLQWHKRLAENRRTVPRGIQQIIAQLLEQHHAIDDDKGTNVNVEDTEAVNGIQDLDTAEIAEAVKKNIALAEELAQTIPMQDERTERVKVVSTEIKALRP